MKTFCNLKWSIQKIDKRHLDDIVSIHNEAFPHFFTTKLGSSFLKAMYGWFTENPLAIGYVATNSAGNAIGFVVGASMSVAMYKKTLSKEKRIALILGIVKDILQCPSQAFLVINSVIHRTAHLISAILKRSRNRKELSVHSFSDAYLTSIAVLSDMRGTGVAQELLTTFVNEVKERGHFAIDLIVRDENIRAIRFYLKNAWKKRYGYPRSDGIPHSLFTYVFKG